MLGRTVLCLGFAAALSAQVGKDWGVERTSYADPVTGLRVQELTSGPGASANLYFHFSNFTADNRYIIFGSDRTGSAQIYRVEVESGRIVQLTAEPGVAAYGACPHPKDARRLFYTIGAEVFEIDIESFAKRRVGAFPQPMVGGLQQPTVSHDLEWLVISGQRGPDTWEIGRLHLKTGEYRRVIQQGFRIGHVQHSPTDPLIFYVWETGGYAPQRSWVVRPDGTGNRPFYASTDPKQWKTPLKEWITHEAWVAGTGDMTMIFDRLGVLLVRRDGSWQVLREGWYWHAAASADGQRLVLDDFENRLWLMETATGNTRLLAADFREKGKIHGHPSFDRRGHYVLFNCTRNQRQTIAVIDLRELPGR